MKAENSGLEANGCHQRTRARCFNRINHARLSEYPPQMLENQADSMMLDRLPALSIENCHAQVCAAQAGKIQLTALSRGQYPGINIPPGTLPGLNSIGFWDGTGPQDWGIAAQRNRSFQLYFVETGNMAFEADERPFTLGAGDFALTRPWQLHQLGAPHIKPGRVHWLTFDLGVRNPNDQWRWPDWITLTPEDLNELTQKLRRNKLPVFKSTPEIARIFQQIAACVVQWNQPHSVSRMMAYLNQLFVCLLDIPENSRSSEKPVRSSNQQVVEAFLKGLQDNPKNCEEIISLKQMANQCNMGVTAFAKLTRQFANVGPMEFLKQCRLNHAAKQLRERPGVSITDVCFSHGFNSSQYFATCFRKQFKMSPSEFVSKQR